MKRNIIMPALIFLLLAGCARGPETSVVPAESSASSATATIGTGQRETGMSETPTDSSNVHKTQPGGSSHSQPVSTAAPTATKSTQTDRTTTSRKSDQSTNTTTTKVSTTAPTTPTTKKPNVRECVYNAELSAQIFNMVNDYRQQNGVAKLVYNATNAEYARRQAEYNAVNDVPQKGVHAVYQIGVSGTGVDITGITSIVNRAKEAWINSPGHKANMLDPDMNFGGAAVYEIRFNGVCEEFVAIVDFDSVNFPKPVPDIKK